MQSQVLWAISEELGGAEFERLCVDLLYRNGYKDIVPIEPQDGGRDAEELPRNGRDRDAIHPISNSASNPVGKQRFGRRG